MTQTKIQGKFYPLQHEEFIILNQRLNASELAVYLWLKTNEPFGDKLVETDTKAIALDLNISRRTVQRALAKLQKEKLIDLVITKFHYRVKSKPTKESDDTDKVKERLRVATPVSPDDISVAIGTGMSPSVRECRHRYENVANSTSMSSPEAEMSSEQSSQNPKTLQTYTDFKKTLSEDERENFLKFVEEVIRNLEKPINDLEAWLASKNAANQNRWEVYYQNYQQQKIQQKPRNSQQNQGSDDLSPEKKQAIALFRKRMKLGQPVDEPEPEDTNSEEYQQQKAAFDELLSSPPERREKSLAEQRREAIAEAKRKQEELNCQRKEAAAEWAKQLDQDYEQRKAEMLRQIEELNQRQQQQNTAINSEINSENSENE